MIRLPRSLVLVAFATAVSGCGGCNDNKAPSAPAQPAATAAAPAPAAAEPGEEPKAAAPGGADSEVDCFVIVDAEPDFGAPPLTVNFITEIDCTGQPVTYSWDFGDGTKGGNDPKPVHTYAKAGDYVATVTVTAPDGGTGSDEIDITVDSDLSE
ncbi:PKD domain-containing protein [bacterium]|nr:PKD domain-containing protein [bacterium]